MLLDVGLVIKILFDSPMKRCLQYSHGKIRRMHGTHLLQQRRR